MMGAVADAVIEASGRTIGVIPTGLDIHEQRHRGLSEVHVVGSMHERKALMEELSDALVALPGGYGTLDELFEALTWAVLGIHKKPCGVLNTAGYWNPILESVEHMLREGFITQGYRDALLCEETPESLLARMERFTPPSHTIWRGAGRQGGA